MKKLFLVAVAAMAVLSFVACEPEDQTEQTYEINAIDKEDVEDPGTRGEN